MRGWEGLYGRPRPVHLADILGKHDHLPTLSPHPAGDGLPQHSGFFRCFISLLLLEEGLEGIVEDILTCQI